MSRSYRIPIATDQQGHPKRVRWWKRQASKWARRHELPDWGAYKRNRLSYEIRDWEFWDEGAYRK